jgi:Xaa-Pro aminopeptidase
MIKTEEEIKLIKKAMELGRKGFNDFKQNLPEYIGKTEQWMAFENKKILTKNGELDISFEPIIALEKNAAKPHATPTNKKYEEGKILLIDAGIKYKRYCSDRTETYINKKSKEQQKVYDIVLKAQEEVIKKGRSGMKASELDILARTYIDKQGFGKFFVHSTGHGVGVDIHEFPYITKNNNVIIEDNMTFSVEPGIYLPNNFGVRIEDCVSVKNGKLELL